MRRERPARSAGGSPTASVRNVSAGAFSEAVVAALGDMASDGDEEAVGGGCGVKDGWDNDDVGGCCV